MTKIDIVAKNIKEILPLMDDTFTSHDVIKALITKDKVKWDEFVEAYAKSGREKKQKEQIAVQQIGCYLGRNAKILNLSNEGKEKNHKIPGLEGHNPREAAKWSKQKGDK